MQEFDLTALPHSELLDLAHERGFVDYLRNIGHDKENASHISGASRALAQVQKELNTNRGPKYEDPYIVSSYLVRYHLQHCSLSYWAYKVIFDHLESIPSSMYVCDVGAGTKSGLIGLILALSERPETPFVTFDSFDTSREMLSGGACFLEHFKGYFPEVKDWNLRDFVEPPEVLPALPPNTLRLLTAFHLSLPYSDRDLYRGGYNPRGKPHPAQSSLQATMRLVAPEITMFTCHEDKVGSLGRFLGNTYPFLSRMNIPRDQGLRNSRSRFYTEVAPSLGFDVTEGYPVSTWSLYRFSLPSGKLLYSLPSREGNVAQIREANEEYRLGGIDPLSVPDDPCVSLKERGTDGAKREQASFSVGDRVRIDEVAAGTLQRIRKDKATVVLNNGIRCEVPISELRHL